MHVRPHRNWHRLAAALLTGLVLACGGSEPAAPPPAPLFPLGALAGARYEWIEGRAPAPEQTLELSPWRLLTAGDDRLDSLEQAETAGYALGLEQGGVALFGPQAAAYSVVEIPEGVRRLNLRALASIRGYTVDPAAAAAHLILLELPGVPQAQLGKQIVANTLAIHNEALIFGSDDRGRPQWLQVSLQPKTRAVAIACTHRSESGRGEAYFDDFEVRTAGPLTQALEHSEQSDLAYSEPVARDADGRQRPRRARYSVDLVHRYGIPVLPGSTAALPLSTDAARTAFECFVTVIGKHTKHDWRFDFEWRSAEGAIRSLASAEVQLRGERHPLVAPTGWTRVTGTLPADAQGELLLRATPAGDPFPRSVPVVAGLVLTDPDRERASDPRPNVLLVSIDTLRADRLEPRLMPRLSALAERAHRFDSCWSTSSWTLPAHMSLFTGQAPTVHGVQRSSLVRDPARSRSLVEDLAAAGYRAAAFTAGGMVLPRFGYMPGFERYSTLDPGANFDAERMLEIFRATAGGDDPRVRAASDVDAMQAWVERAADAPWFLFVHTYAAHEFEPPSRCLEALGLPLEPDISETDLRDYLSNGELPPTEDLERLRQLYDATALQADELVGSLIDVLERTDQLDSTVIVVTSDHGKELGEHGVVAHANALHEELVHVPLVIHLPGQQSGRRSDVPVSWIDLSPTLRGLTDLERPDELTGLDLLADTLPYDRPIWAEMDTQLVSQAVRAGATKVVRASEPGEPFEWRAMDLAADPGEQRPGSPSPADRSLLLDHYERLINERDALPMSLLAPEPLDDATRAQLEALGYTDD